MRLLRDLLFVLVVLVCLPAVAWAEPSEADKATARALAIEAQQALQKGAFGVAADKFRRADEIYHAPTLLVGLARAYVGLRKYVEAQETYNRVIREPLASDASDAFKKAVDDANKEVVGLDEKIAWVTFTVAGPDEPTVTLDGEPLSAASLGVKRAVNPGEHQLTASASGYAEGATTFSVAAGQTDEVRLELAAAAPGGGDQVEPSDGGSILPILGWTAIGVGGAGLILGAVTGGLALGKHGELSDNCGDGGVCAPDQQDNLDSFHTMGTISTIGFIAGGVLAATGVVLLIVAPSDGDEAAAASLETRIGIGQLSATLRF